MLLYETVYIYSLFIYAFGGRDAVLLEVHYFYNDINVHAEVMSECHLRMVGGLQERSRSIGNARVLSVSLTARTKDPRFQKSFHPQAMRR